jgi:hypothetical protein
MCGTQRISIKFGNDECMVNKELNEFLGEDNNDLFKGIMLLYV